MKAVIFEKTGAPLDVLQMKDVQVPKPAAGEVRVKILASPINPADTLFISGKYRIKPQFPQITGLEGVGIIDKVSEGSTFSLGTLVAFRYKGLWADHAIVPEEKLIPLPAGYPVEKAAQLSLNPITAYALLDVANISQDDWLLINAGNSGVSRIIIQLAALRGIKTIVVTRNDKEAHGLDQLGATEVITSQQGGLTKKIMEITGNAGVACVLDAVGGELLSEVLTVMAPFGKVISYGLLDKANVSYHNSTVIFKNLTIVGFGIDAWLSDKGNKVHEIYRVLADTIANPEFKMPVAALFPMADFYDAFTYQESNFNKGKVLMTMNGAENLISL